MPSNYIKSDDFFGSVDLDDEYITDAWLVDKYVGNALWAAGSNSSLSGGMLGDGTSVNKSSPVQVGALVSWKNLCVTRQTSHAIRTDGTLWSWGNNSRYSLGNNTKSSTAYSSPIQIGALTNWKQLHSGAYLIQAVKTDGTLWGWGDGDTGNGTSVVYSSPIQVGSLTNWKYVNAGTFSSVALKTDGTLWSWGDGTLYGQLGTGGFDLYLSPVQIGSSTDWCEVSETWIHTLAIKTDGTLWSWGANFAGKLGFTTTNGAAAVTPVQVGSMNNWKKVQSGGDSSLALKTDGTLWAWGYNADGQLGNGTIVNYSSPIQIGTLTDWKQISAGYSNSYGIKIDGTLWAWGDNTNGKLGNGTTVSYSSPIQIGTLTTWKTVFACDNSFLALTYTEI